MQLQEVLEELEKRGWYRIDQNLRLEDATDVRLYAHRDRPGVVITLVGPADTYLGPGALANIFAQAGIDSMRSREPVADSESSAINSSNRWAR